MNNSFLNENEKFSQMNYYDIDDILATYWQLQYRPQLNLSPKITFGVEIEFEDMNYFNVEDFLTSSQINWKLDIDLSVVSGGEIISPKLSDNKNTWQVLKQICEYLKKNHANTSQNAGAHIHVGADILGNNIEKWQRFLIIYTIYERVLFHFFYGEKNYPRNGVKKHACPIAEEMFYRLKVLKKCQSLEDLAAWVPQSRKQAVNFTNIKWSKINQNCEKNTIEFRTPNGTKEETIWQNMINTILHLLLIAEKNIDMDYLNYKLEHEFSSYYFNSLNGGINPKDALEFVDFIFQTNLDKINFLLQYFKGYSVADKRVRVRNYFK